MHLQRATLAPIHLANDAGGLDIHSVNAASAASYAQTECKEASTAAQSGEMQGKASPRGMGRYSDD
jgi:hypothetical protein